MKFDSPKGAPKQTTDTLLMVRPAAFHANPGTMESNPFQDRSAIEVEQLTRLACAEFDRAVELLRSAGVRVIVIQDDPMPATPDSIFPNNWFSTHRDGSLLLFPMQEKSRRCERRLDLLKPALRAAGYGAPCIDASLVERFESQETYLEGTGSMVLDRVQRVAYACRSSRTHSDALNAFCGARGYRAHAFDAADDQGRAYYHTNVILGLGLDFAVLCMDSVPPEQREALRKSLETSGRALISLSREQVRAFAANILEARSMRGERLVLLSSSAHESLSPEQRSELCLGGARLLSLPIPNIERYGGGSLRCMLAEIFLPLS